MESLNFAYLACFAFIIIIDAQSDEKKIFIFGDTAKVSEMKGLAEVPRVKVKVFRGPSKERDGEQFVPWGFWIRQPAGIKSKRSIPFAV